jgi:hypothetical protein
VTRFLFAACAGRFASARAADAAEAPTSSTTAKTARTTTHTERRVKVDK